MAERPDPIRLREAPHAAPPEATVIDADFKVVGRRRAMMRRVGFWLLAFAGAAAIGFLIPPIWLIIEEIAALFS
jgi:hypothetical protein